MELFDEDLQNSKQINELKSEYEVVLIIYLFMTKYRFECLALNHILIMGLMALLNFTSGVRNYDLVPVNRTP